jgi:hypothetical protein
VPALAFACGDDEVFDSETGGRVVAGRERKKKREERIRVRALRSQFLPPAD